MTHLVGIAQYVQGHVLGIILAIIASFIVGFTWHGPLFGKQWMKLNNYTEEELKGVNPGPLYAQSFVATLVMYAVLAHFLGEHSDMTWMGGAEVGCIVWFGFITPVQFTANLFSKKPRGAYLLDTGYQLVSTVAAGIILAVWR